MIKNETFFSNKNWEEVFSTLNFDKHYEKLCHKLKNKKVLMYGAGIMFDYFYQNYDMGKLNIVGISDKKFALDKLDKYNNYKLFAPNELIEQDIDTIIISTVYPVSVRNFLKYQIYKNKRMPKIYFLLNKPFKLYLEEIIYSL